MRTKLIALTAVATALAMTQVAWAHTTLTSNGVSVTMHIAPDDEPQAGEPSTIKVVRVRRSGWDFSYAACRCAVRITDSSGRVLLSRRVRRSSIGFTFPKAGAYAIKFSGRMTRNGRGRSFSPTFAYRAY
jgi:hypothetical protein